MKRCLGLQRIINCISEKQQQVLTQMLSFPYVKVSIVALSKRVLINTLRIPKIFTSEF